MFGPAQNGDATPLKKITAGQANGFMLTFGVAVIEPEGGLWISASSTNAAHLQAIAQFPIGANGPVGPACAISGANTLLHSDVNTPKIPVFLAAHAGLISAVVGTPNGLKNSVWTYTGCGNVAPSSRLGGSNTGWHQINGIAYDRSGNLYVTEYDDNAPVAGVTSVRGFYPTHQNGNFAPDYVITGPNTQLFDAVGVAFGP